MKLVRLALAIVSPLVVLFAGLLSFHERTSPAVAVAQRDSSLPSASLRTGPTVAQNDNVQKGDSLIAQEDWPPQYENLSSSRSNSVYADMGAIEVGGQKVLVAAWTEGVGEDRVSGSIKMRWRFEGGEWMTVPRTHLPQGNDQEKYSYPALALHRSADNSSVQAHVVWLKQYGDYMWVQYGLYTLTAAASTFSGFETASSDQEEFKTLTLAAPDIALNDDGCPHVVWTMLDPSKPAGDPTRSQVYYNNKCGGSWGNGGQGWAIAGGQEKDNPVVAVRGNDAIYVAWEDNGSQPGIQVARRTGAGSGSGGWSAAERISNYLEDDLPSIAVDTIATDGVYRVYVMWQRWIEQDPYAAPPYAAYALSYRVFTGTLLADHWWPGGEDINQCASVFTSTTHTPDLAGDEFYLGLRPSIAAVNRTLHVVYQYDSEYTDDGGIGGGDLAIPSEMASGELAGGVRPSDEGLVKDFKVVYAYASHRYVPSKVGWITKPITMAWVSYYEKEPVFTNPSLAVIPGDDYPHIALQKRFAVPAQSGNYGWDVWYANGKDFPYDPGEDPACPDGPCPVYLPALFKSYY